MCIFVLSDDAVVWFNSPDEIAAKIELMLSDDVYKVVVNAKNGLKKSISIPQNKPLNAFGTLLKL
jgi:hypothetical protein